MKNYNTSQYLVAKSYCNRTKSDCRFCICNYQKLNDLCDRIRKELREEKHVKV